MNAVIISRLFVLLIFVGTLVQGQNIELLKKYSYKQFDVESSISLNYTSHSFLVRPDDNTIIEEPSVEKINELKDSFHVSGDLTCLRKIGEMYLALNQIDTGKYYFDECKSRCLELFERKPGNRNNLQNLCTLYMEMGELFSAIEIADQMLDLNPNDSWAIITNFILTFGIGDFQTANRYCEIAVVECPEDPVTYFLKTMLLTMAEWSEASKNNAFEGFKADFSYLDKIQETFNHNPEIKLVTESCKLYILFIENAGKIVYNNHRSEAVDKINLNKADSLKLALIESQFQEMLDYEIFRKHYTVFQSLGMVNILNEKYLKAIEYFKESIALSGWSQNERESVISNYDNIIYCCILEGDTILARKWTKIKMADKRTFASRAEDFVTLARYELTEKHLRNGEKFLKKAILCDSTTFEAYVELANIEMIRNNLGLAEEYLDKCFKLKMDYPPLYQSFILLSLYRGDFETARFFIERLLKNEPDNLFADNIKKDFL